MNLTIEVKPRRTTKQVQVDAAQARVMKPLFAAFVLWQEMKQKGITLATIDTGKWIEVPERKYFDPYLRREISYEARKVYQRDEDVSVPPEQVALIQPYIARIQFYRQQLVQLCKNEWDLGFRNRIWHEMFDWVAAHDSRHIYEFLEDNDPDFYSAIRALWTDADRPENDSAFCKSAYLFYQAFLVAISVYENQALPQKQLEFV